jgi:hypothetical protein
MVTKMAQLKRHAEVKARRDFQATLIGKDLLRTPVTRVTGMMSDFLVLWHGR